MSVLFLFIQAVSIWMFGCVFYDRIFFFVLGALCTIDCIGLWVIVNSIIIRAYDETNIMKRRW